MAEILHQLRLVVYPIIYRVSYIPGGAGFPPSTVGYILVITSGLKVQIVYNVCVRVLQCAISCCNSTGRCLFP